VGLMLSAILSKLHKLQSLRITLIYYNKWISISVVLFLSCFPFPFQEIQSAQAADNTSARYVRSLAHTGGKVSIPRSKVASHEATLQLQLQEIAITAKEVEDEQVQSQSTEKKVWGVAKQIGEHTWTINVGRDEKTGSAQEIFQALNAYRQKKGRHTLSWDSTLATYAQSRADTFAGMKTTDAHAGFRDLINNQDGFKKLGFMALGENSSYGYHLEGVHLIEWVYAGDAPHDDNQLSTKWSHVGVGVNGTATDLIFGGNKM
jgi:uncharacterized protein YkwD